MTSETQPQGLWARWQGLTLWIKVLIGMALGVVVGVTVGDVINPYIEPLGEIFKRLFRMLIVPLIFFSLVSGITSMTDLKEMGRVGGKTFVIYLFTTAIAVTIGLCFGYLFQPGAGVEFGGGEIVVYNVHLHTPRDQLRAMRRGAFIRGLWPSEARRNYQKFWDRQINWQIVCWITSNRKRVR